MSEVPIYQLGIRRDGDQALQGYLVQKKTPTPLGPPEAPRHYGRVLAGCIFS